MATTSKLRADILTVARIYSTNANHATQSSERRASDFVAFLSGFLQSRDPELAAAIWAVLQPQNAPLGESAEQSSLPA